MINETGKAKDISKSLKTTQVASPAASRPATPPFGVLSNRLVQSCKDEDTLYRCSSVESLDSPTYTPELTALSNSDDTKKYITQDYSPYNSRAPSPANRKVSRPHTGCTSFLKPRMEFSGFQISGYKKNQVKVVLQTVDLPIHASDTSMVPHLTGFFSIQGLTTHQPEITTFFEAYAVTENLGFLSSDMPSHLDDLKANDNIDLEHWLNFPCFKDMCTHKKVLPSMVSGSHAHTGYLHKRFIYMRWKEKFLVPDADLDSVEGASYDGYYYIVHDQLTGNIVGLYYHKDAEKFQQLELAPVRDLCSGSCDFEFN
ncbi:LANO_0B07338g1_1 [Lachancea nothofagi CBS 11611]|uniref:LANO_0B07338g1_1 n=1 Tax=Lachancea nothofagi CBS 11611 TaxID=1266666 RepID=A0A1G4IZS0_9SACH|nr:LANO_0B07338g1_1 [Lachancea nothofagi CBS 11611]